MGNGSIYFWDKEICTKSISGHLGSVSALCLRKNGPKQSFVSGDKCGKIIVWSEAFEQEKVFILPKTNSPSQMIVALDHFESQLLVGTKSSFIYKVGLN